MDAQINYLAVLVSGVVMMVLGYLWYGPLFGKPWMKLSGISMEKINASKGDMPRIYGLQFLGALVTAYVLAHIVYFAGALSWMDGAAGGFWSWLGFVAPVMLSSVLYEGKPLKLYIINSGYYLVGLLVMGAILASWV